MSSPTDTNQASDDELRDLVIKTMRYANSVTPHKLNEPIDPFVDGAIDFAVDEMKALIRTEKLKLLAEVRERVVGEFSELDSNGRYNLKVEQRAALTKLEAEL